MAMTGHPTLGAQTRLLLPARIALCLGGLLAAAGAVARPASVTAEQPHLSRLVIPVGLALILIGLPALVIGIEAHTDRPVTAELATTALATVAAGPTLMTGWVGPAAMLLSAALLTRRFIRTPIASRWLAAWFGLATAALLVGIAGPGSMPMLTVGAASYALGFSLAGLLMRPG